MPKTTLSSKGQIVIPKAIREAQNWPVGTVFEMGLEGGNLVLRPEAGFPVAKPLTLDEMLAKIPRYTGPVRTLEDMEEAIAEAILESWNQSISDSQ